MNASRGSMQVFVNYCICHGMTPLGLLRALGVLGSPLPYVATGPPSKSIAVDVIGRNYGRVREGMEVRWINGEI